MQINAFGNGIDLTRDHMIALGQLIVHLAAFGIYNRKAIRKESAPSKATWALWAALAVINAVSYRATTGDLFKAILGIIDAGACTITFLVVLRYHGTTELAKNERWALGIGFSAALIGIILQSGFIANAMLQAAMVVSFYPALMNTWTHPRHEPRLPWGLWTGVYISNLILVFLRWQGSWRDVVHPVTYILLHGALWVLTMRKGKDIDETQPSHTEPATTPIVEMQVVTTIVGDDPYRAATVQETKPKTGSPKMRCVALALTIIGVTTIGVVWSLLRG